MAEQQFYSSGGILVTNSRFVVPGQTYAMQGVTSIRNEVEHPSKKSSVITIAIGLLVTLFSFGVFSSSVEGGIIMLIIGLALIAGGILWWRALKPTWYVILSSASGEARTLGDKDDEKVSQIIRALNDAIVSRG